MTLGDWLSRKMGFLPKLKELLPWHQRVRAAWLFLLTLTTAGVEAMGIASVAPFLAVLAAPELVESNQYLKEAYLVLGMKSREQFLIALGMFSFAGLVASVFCRGLNSWAQVRFSRSIEYVLACRLMTGYLSRPYAFYLGRNNADLSRMVLQEVSQAVNGFIRPIIEISSSSIIAAFLLALLCVVSPILALSATIIIGVIYTGMFLAARRWLSSAGEKRLLANRQRFQSAGEVFGGIKEIKLLGNEQFYLKKFAAASSQIALIQSAIVLIGTLPVYALELMVFGGSILLILLLLHATGDVAGFLPLFVLFALCARRLLPAMQNIYKNVTTLRSSHAVVDRLLRDFRDNEQHAADASVISKKPLAFTQGITLEDVSLAYSNSNKFAVRKVSLHIPVGARVGFVGATGSGKTTTMDVILGLLVPNEGRLLVDGVSILPQDLLRWQANLGYVPQSIYLADDTVAANIALGISDQKFDWEAVENAARTANIHDFIEKELPFGYLTTVGERGVRLSGGQRQRIGIARALYRKPKVLLFDEATSALDNRTEKGLMDALNSLDRDTTTMVLIAHRLTTVRDCDKIYVFADGEIQASGTYAELTTDSAEFQSLVSHGA